MLSSSPRLASGSPALRQGPRGEGGGIGLAVRDDAPKTSEFLKRAFPVGEMSMYAWQGCLAGFYRCVTNPLARGTVIGDYLYIYIDGRKVSANNTHRASDPSTSPGTVI